MSNGVSGIGQGQGNLNGVQTTGREYKNLSEPHFEIRRTNNIAVIMRDHVSLMADLFQPDAEDRFPALISFSPYPRQLQDVGAPLGFIEAGNSHFFVRRGYVHLIVNARGTGGSGGTWGLFDRQERNDLYDIIEWAAVQPWCDGNVGMLGISYFAMVQLAAAVTKPPHLKAIAPLLTTDNLYDAAIHHGLLNSGFISAWLPAVGVMSQKPDKFWRSARIDLARDILSIPAIHSRLQHLNGEAIVSVLKHVIHSHYPENPFGELWRAIAIEHPTNDGFWEERSTRPLLGSVEIPIYLGADWDNVPLHLPSTLTAWKALRHNPNVRMALLPPGGFSWPWESLHYEVLAWYDHWLKGRETGIMDGPPIRYQIPGTDGWRTAIDWPPPQAQLISFALRADGVLGRDEGNPGFRKYLHLPADSGQPSNINTPDVPSMLTWETGPLERALEFAGSVELKLEATITALDTSWIAVLYDISPTGTSEAITAGWLRASFSEVDETQSLPGSPFLPCVKPVAICPNMLTTYRIPLVDNARHLSPGHRLRLVLASSDEADKFPTVLGFTHTVVREASLNAISSASRLWLPVLPTSA